MPDRKRDSGNLFRILGLFTNLFFGRENLFQLFGFGQVPGGYHDSIQRNASLDGKNDGGVPDPLQIAELDQFPQGLPRCVPIALEDQFRTINFLIIHTVANIVGSSHILSRGLNESRNIPRMFPFESENIVMLVPGLLDPFRQWGFHDWSDCLEYEPFINFSNENSAMRVG